MAEQKKKLTISEVNALDFNEFIAKFGSLVEHCPLCAAAVWGETPFQNYEELQRKFEDFLDQLPTSGKAGVLRLYPDLAGKLAQSGELSAESVREHASAGLDTLTDEERARMTDLNTKYKKQFGFPFVVCARQNKKDAILIGLEKRLTHTLETEAVTGVNEVKKICGLRLRDLVDDTSVAKL